MTTADELFGDMEMGTIISCPVCRETFNLQERSPLNIPCGHTVCTQCSTSLVPRNGTPVMMCPVCRKKHYGQNQAGRCKFNFPKNYQLLEVVEKVAKLKQQADRRRDELRFVKCIECEAQVSEEACTICTCVIGPSGNDFDFMDRPKNKLICIDCIIARHGTHDSKPMEAVKAASDNWKLMNELKAAFEKTKKRAEGAQTLLNNCKEELSSVQQEMNNVMAHINKNPRNTATFCTAAKFLTKLGELDKTVEGIGKVAYSDATNIGAHITAIKDCIRNGVDRNCSIRPEPVLRELPFRIVQPPRPPPQQAQVEAAAPAVPAVPGRAEVAENLPQANEAENVQIFIHMRDGDEREAHVRQAMQQFEINNPDALAIGNAPARVHNGNRNDERLNGLVRGIFEFVDGVMAGEREQRDGHNRARDAGNANAANDELLDEVALVEQEVVNGVPRQLVRRRVQVRLRFDPPMEVIVRNVPVRAPAQGAPEPAQGDPQLANQAPEPAQEEVEMEEALMEEPVAARRRGRPRLQPAAAQPIVRVGARRAARVQQQNEIPARPVAGNARNARRTRRRAGRR